MPIYEPEHGDQLADDNEFKIRYYDMISNEILVFCILRHLPLKDLFRCQRVCREWNRILKNKKFMSSIYQSICTDELFKPHVYPGTQAYLSTFGNWRSMIKLRPRIRCDGVYICKIIYVRYGLSDTSEYRPCHEVTFYKYMRFFQNGKLISAYTCQPPKKFLPKFAAKVIDVIAIMNEDQDNWGPEAGGTQLPFKDICV